MQKNINGVGYTPRLIVNPDWDPSIDVKICEEIHKANSINST